MNKDGVFFNKFQKAFVKYMSMSGNYKFKIFGYNYELEYTEGGKNLLWNEDMELLGWINDRDWVGLAYRAFMDYKKAEEEKQILLNSINQNVQNEHVVEETLAA